MYRFISSRHKDHALRGADVTFREHSGRSMTFSTDIDPELMREKRGPDEEEGPAYERAISLNI